MAPEQMVGVDADARSDQYAFGLTAYELLAGTHPGGAMIEARPKRIDEISKDLSAELATVLERMLEREPGARFASMDDVVHALEASIATMRAPPPYMTPPPMTTATPSQETAETMSAEKIEIAMRPSNKPAATVLAVLAEAGAAREGRSSDHESTLVTREAPSALLRGRDAPVAKTLPLGAVAPAAAAPMLPRTLVSGHSAPKVPSNPPPAAAAAPVVQARSASSMRWRPPASSMPIRA
jgi:serine/threonine protein kinase